MSRNASINANLSIMVWSQRPMVVYLPINAFLAIPKHFSNGRGASNGHIDSPRRSPILRGPVVPVRFKSYMPTSCEVFSVTSSSFSNLDFLLLSFLSFFHMI
jgi:hypothetical protein